MDLFDPNDERLERLGPFGQMVREGAQLVGQLAAQDSPDALAGAIRALDDRGVRIALLVAVMAHKNASTSADDFYDWYHRDVPS